MKINKTLTALIAGASLGMSGQAFAAGTAAGTSIKNTATLNFKVSSVQQGELTNFATFLVDNKVNLSLIRQSGDVAVDITPNGPTGGDTYQVIYRLTNTGNQTQDYKITVGELTSGDIDVADVNGVDPVTDIVNLGAALNIYIDNDDDGLEPTDTTAYVDNLAPDAGRNIYVVIDSLDPVDPALVDNAIAGIFLTAETQALGINSASGDVLDDVDHSAVPFNPALEQIVLADTGNDGKITLNAAFEVITANLAIEKSVTVKDDNLGIASANPKAIPGATLTYTITVKNTGSASASAVTVLENLNLDDTNNTNLGELDLTSIDNLSVTDSNPASTTDQATFITSGILTVVYDTVAGGTLISPETKTITFDINIK